MTEFIHVILDPLRAVRDYFHTNLFFGLGMLLLAGYFGGRLAQKVKFPAVTGYVVAGLVLGGSVLNLVPAHVSDRITPVIPAVALGLIALTIGGEFSIRVLRRYGRALVAIAAIQLLVTFTVVVVALALFGCQLYQALLLGAIASATAPAATVAVLNECRASGPLTRTIIGVVAIDDALCIMLFGVVFAISGALATGVFRASLLNAVGRSLLEIFGAIVLGTFVGLCVHFLIRKRESRNEILIIVLGAVLCCAGVAETLKLSPLIANMIVGFLLVNLSERNRRVFGILAPVEVPIYAAFFTIAGTDLNVGVFATAGLFGIVYIVARILGKTVGAGLATRVIRSEDSVGRYLGLGLLPQAGVAIGLVYLIKNSPVYPATPEFAQATDTMVNIVLASVLFNELIGPPLTKFAVVRAGEMGVKCAKGAGDGAEPS